MIGPGEEARRGLKGEERRMEPIRDLAVRIGDLLLQGAEMMREPLDIERGGENLEFINYINYG